MPESPLNSSPYEVLGVAASASQEELRRAFRKALRETHPDTGGDPARFTAVQLAWERVGTVEDRAAYDAGRSGTEGHPVYTANPTAPRQDTRPRARSYGHPGGWRRERYLEQLREWVGRGVDIDDPYDPALVRSAPREIRRTLADALAEEATARILGGLGIGFTIWHDVATGHPEDKLDHVVLGPTGLWALLSEDFGGPVRVRRGELIGEAVGHERPVHDLAARAKALSRQARVKVTGLVVVLPDDSLDEPIASLGSVRGAAVVAVRRSVLGTLLRGGIAGAAPIGGNELFDVRTRLASSIRFV
ncbi:J domain-containing protein [Salinibacterium soli]|uniref:DnaJ domain-containing protein n=1 Tax=Antiquaquibacter soli TaxID=3064523 RepID=A0ABT9BMR7_9MICO|nr:DnaJ domain-containing protein [Protaetiibacter sp. WY-16]MDO7881889.1 DnaJ domain-containing protein [Protaetiibacter sp. WY-16]